MSWVIDDTNNIIHNDKHTIPVPDLNFETEYIQFQITDDKHMHINPKKPIINCHVDNTSIKFIIDEPIHIIVDKEIISAKPDNIYIQFDMNNTEPSIGIHNKKPLIPLAYDNTYIQFLMDDFRKIGLYNRNIINYAQDVNQYVFLINDEEGCHRTPKRDFHLGGFRDGHMKKVIIPRSCKKIADFAFFNSQIKKVKIASDCEYGEFSFPPDCEITFYDDN